MSYSSIWPIDRILSGATTPTQSARIAGVSLSDCFMSYLGHSLVRRIFPLCRDAVVLFYSPSWLDSYFLVYIPYRNTVFLVDIDNSPYTWLNNLNDIRTHQGLFYANMWGNRFLCTFISTISCSSLYIYIYIYIYTASQTYVATTLKRFILHPKSVIKQVKHRNAFICFPGPH